MAPAVHSLPVVNILFTYFNPLSPLFRIEASTYKDMLTYARYDLHGSMLLVLAIVGLVVSVI